MGFEDDVDTLAQSLKRVSIERASLVFVAASQRLYPLYSNFLSEEHWDPPENLGLVLESVWSAVASSNAPGPELAERILNSTPDGEQFDNLKATLALDFCTCLDAAIRCLRSEARFDFRVIDANLEAIRMPLCFHRTGFLDFPDDDRFSSVETEVRSDARYLGEIVRINEDIRDALAERLSQQQVEAVQARAFGNAITWEYLGL